MRMVAMCGSLREGSYNQALLDEACRRAEERGLEIVQLDWSRFPVYSTDLESAQVPADVESAKALLASADGVLLVTPEYNHGIPGGLKNAVDWLSRPYPGTPLLGLPMALMGASSGYMGSIRAQLAWRQMWYFFRSPVFSEAELCVAFAGKSFDESGVLVDERYSAALDRYLESLMRWLESAARELG